MKLQRTNYSLWWAVNPYVNVYLPIKEEDCYCLTGNLKNQEPKSLLERSLFFVHPTEQFSESSALREPVLKEWYGTLPSCSPFKHLLRISKLTGWEGKDKNNKPIIPFKLKGMSHEIHCFYHPKRESNCIRLLFRIQVGAPEEVTLQLAAKLANEFKNVPRHQGYLLLRPKLESYSDNCWAEFVAIHLEQLLKTVEI